MEHKKLTQDLEDLERSSEYMKSILEDLHLEEVSSMTLNTQFLYKSLLISSR